MTGRSAPAQAVDPTDPYVAAFEMLERGLNGASASPMHGVRRAGFEAFRRLGFPTPRDEAWKSVDLSAITGTPFAVREGAGPDLSPAQVSRFLFDGLEGTLLVFVDGRHDPALSVAGPLPDGVTATSLAAALDGEDERVLEHLARHADPGTLAFTALNTAFFQDGAFVHVPRDVVVDRPIRVLHVASGQEGVVSYPRNLVVAEAGSRVTVIETYGGLGDGRVFTNAVTEVVAGEGAEVEHVRPGVESPDAIHVGNVVLDQAKGSRVTSHSVTLGGAFVRNDATSVLGGDGAEATLNGLYFLEGEQHVDNYTTIEHERPGCPSHELYKGILGDRSRAIFRGRIHVHADAQGTDAYQSNQNLLLTDAARIDTKPQLEIYADEVKCSHGATVGQLDDDAFFYLRSRGIGVPAARRILMQAFADEIIGRISVAPVREALDRMVLDKFERIEERTEGDR